MPGAVVVGAHANGLGVIRALGPRGVPIASIPTRAFDIAHRSRWVQEVHPLPGFHDHPDTLLDLLERQRSRWSGWALFPTHDDALTVLSRHHADLARHYRLTVPPWPIASQFTDKDRLHQLAVSAGLPVPHCYGPATPETIGHTGLTYPVIVKPVQHGRLISRYGVKLFVATDAAALRSAVGRLAACDMPGLIYELIPGPDRDIVVHCLYVDRFGTASPGLTVRKLRQYPAMTGGACAAEIVADVPGLRAQTLALVRHAGYHGMVFAEFKRDARDGTMRFIEVNGRAVLFNALLAQAGLDLVGLAWQEAIGVPLPAMRARTRRVWVHLQADVLRAAAASNGDRVSVRDWLAPYLSRPADAVFAWRDPLPFAAQSWRALTGALRRH